MLRRTTFTGTSIFRHLPNLWRRRKGAADTAPGEEESKTFKT